MLTTSLTDQTKERHIEGRGFAAISASDSKRDTGLPIANS